MEKDLLEELVVVKRSGQRVNFNDTKIALAVKKGFDSVYEEYDEKLVNKVKEKVLSEIRKNYKDRKTIGVEDIQDIIEKELKIAGKDLIAIGCPKGEIIGDILENLLKKVLENPKLNQKEILKDIAGTMF